MNSITFAPIIPTRQQRRDGTRHNYLLAINAFERFLGKREMDINRITTKLLHDFSVFLDTEIRPNGKTVKKRGGASIRYVNSLGALFRDAQLYYNDEDEGRILIPRNPFEKVVYASKPSPSEGQNSLSFELIQRILLDRSRAHVDKATIDECLAHSGTLNMADIYVEKDWDVINTANRALLSLFTWP